MNIAEALAHVQADMVDKGFKLQGQNFAENPNTGEVLNLYAMAENYAKAVTGEPVETLVLPQVAGKTVEEVAKAAIDTYKVQAGLTTATEPSPIKPWMWIAGGSALLVGILYVTRNRNSGAVKRK